MFYLRVIFVLLLSPALAHSTELTLSASAQREVSNDQITASFYRQLSHSQPAELANQLNQAAAQGLALGRAYPKVQLSSGSYNTWPDYDKNQNIKGWQGRVTLRLKSRDLAQATELIAKLQQTLLLDGIQFSVSDQTREAAEKIMIPQAITSLKNQAQIAAQTLGQKVIQIKELNIGSASPNYRPPLNMRAAAMSDSAPEVTQPDLQAGESLLQLQINGKVVLK